MVSRFDCNGRAFANCAVAGRDSAKIGYRLTLCADSVVLGSLHLQQHLANADLFLARHDARFRFPRALAIDPTLHNNFGPELSFDLKSNFGALSLPLAR
jgi:hypothetical protein